MEELNIESANLHFACHITYKIVFTEVDRWCAEDRLS